MTSVLLERNAAMMTHQNGFDVVIVCTNTENMASYWQTRLEKGRGVVIPENAMVLSVNEDWPGGAGNGLGTLYAWKKACALAATMGTDLPKILAAKEVSCAMFHTAGKGTRLAPLPGSENNNKPGVKLPVTVAEGQPVSILESVIQQTGIYAASRKGRLSVFWGDQVFIPSVAPEYTPLHHIDILCTLGPMPSAEAWQEKGLDKYGLIAVGTSGESAQVEKVSHETAQRLLSSLGEVSSVGASLGSFSVSAQVVELLNDEFGAELAAKKGKLDTDPGLWMPLTLDQGAYVELMGQKGTSAAEASSHWTRMSSLKAKLKGSPLFGAVDVGDKAYWWDYGQLELYRSNNLKLIEEGHEAATMRSFFKIQEPARVSGPCAIGNLEVTGGSCISSCRIGGGSVAGSLLSRVVAEEVQCEGAILVNVTAKRVIVAPGCIVYNVTSTDPEGLILKEPGSVLTTALLEVVQGPSKEAAAPVDVKEVAMRSTTTTDGGIFWKEKIQGNEMSFEEVYEANASADVGAMEVVAAKLHSGAASMLSL